MYIKPVGDLVIRDPRSRVLLPAEGAEVPETAFWLRRLRDESVELADAPKPPADAENAPSTAATEHEEH